MSETRPRAMSTSEMEARRLEREKRREALRLEEEALEQRKAEDRARRRLELEHQRQEDEEEAEYERYVRERLKYLEDDVKRMQDEQAAEAEERELQAKQLERRRKLEEEDRIAQEKEAQLLKSKEEARRRRSYSATIREREEAQREERARKLSEDSERLARIAREEREAREAREAVERERQKVIEERLRERARSSPVKLDTRPKSVQNIYDAETVNEDEVIENSLTAAVLPVKESCYKFYCDYWILQKGAEAPEIIDDLDYTNEDEEFYKTLTHSLVDYLYKNYADDGVTPKLLQMGDSGTRVFMSREHMMLLEELKQAEIRRGLMALQACIRTFLVKRQYQTKRAARPV